LEAGVITDVSPSSGQVGTVVEIAGERMLGGAESLSTVTIGGVDADVSFESDSSIIVIAASGNSGVSDIIITADTGALVTLVGGFTYLAEGEISLLSPARGQFGTMVSIYGSNLLGGGFEIASLTLNGIVPAEITSFTNDVIKIRAGVSDPGVGTVRIVSNTGSVVELEASFTYDVGSDITDVCVQTEI
jgi:mucin-19